MRSLCVYRSLYVAFCSLVSPSVSQAELATSKKLGEEQNRALASRLEDAEAKCRALEAMLETTAHEAAESKDREQRLQKALVKAKEVGNRALRDLRDRCDVG